MDYEFQRQRSDRIPRSQILEELKKVAQHYGLREFSTDEFNAISGISSGTVKREFGSWIGALTNLREEFKKNGLYLKPRKSRSNLAGVPTAEQLFAEMERVWNQLGHRPSSAEWKSANPVYSYGTLRYRFNGWANACLQFIEYKMGRSILEPGDQEGVQDTPLVFVSEKAKPTITSSNSRTVPLNIRISVLVRDNFRCAFCGRSPATELGVKLQIDHKVPFSKGGKTTIENLQTLCWECNQGKKDRTLPLAVMNEGGDP